MVGMTEGRCLAGWANAEAVHELESDLSRVYNALNVRGLKRAYE